MTERQFVKYYRSIKGNESVSEETAKTFFDPTEKYDHDPFPHFADDMINGGELSYPFGIEYSPAVEESKVNESPSGDK